MPQHQFRLFSNLAFLQSLDKVRSLGPLLAEHRSYFNRQGFNIDELANDDACARALLEVFTKPDERMPGKLLCDLYALDMVADADGHERILEEAEQLKLDLRGMPADVSPGDFAIFAFLKHPHLVRRCHEKTFARHVKRYYEYRSRGDERFGLSDVETAMEASKSILGSWFEIVSAPACVNLLSIRIRMKFGF